MLNRSPQSVGTGFRQRTAAPAGVNSGAPSVRPQPETDGEGAESELGADFGGGGQLRGWLLLVATIWLIFCIYGSLVPLRYRPLPWDLAWQSFHDIRYLNLGVGSRADWVANILLFVPLGFLWTGVLWPQRGIFLRLLVIALVFVLAVLLSLSIEFTQLYFPPRTVSQNDIIAETIGAAIGIGLWCWLGAGLVAWLRAWQRERSSRGVAGRLFWIYLMLLIGYNLLPLDLTISPIEIYHKWQMGRVSLVPFAYPVGTLTEQVYGLLADVLIWVPAGVLLLLGGRRSPLNAWAWLFGVVVVLEFLQLLVWSRVTDTTDLVTGALGAGIGILIGMRWQHAPSRMKLGAGHSRWIRSALMFVGWSAVLAAIFWYPYNFNTDWGFLRGRLEALNRSPLHIYYFGTEFRAITEVIHKVGFFIPLGMIVAWPRLSMRGRIPRRLLDIAMVLLLPAVAMLIELGQVGLPSKYPDITDWVFESTGALGGYFGGLYLAAKVGRGAGKNVADSS